MPVQGVRAFLVQKSDNTYQGASNIPAGYHEWTASSPLFWVVAIALGQADPQIGYIATYNDPTQPWLGATFTPPAPTYKPLATLQNDAFTAISEFGNARINDLTGDPLLNRANLNRAIELHQAEQVRTLTQSEQSEITSLDALDQLTRDIANRALALISWSQAETSQAVLTAFLLDVGNPPDGLGWPG